MNCLFNRLEGEKAAAFNFFTTFFMWFFIIIFFIRKKDGIDLRDSDNDDMPKDSDLYLICGFYLSNLIGQFITGFRQFMKLQNLRDILSNNIENKFSIIFHGKAWHKKDSKEVITYDKKITYNFKSGADFSTIILDLESINKSYWDLEIEIEYICLDEKTKKNHDTLYNNLYDNTKRMDKEFSFEKIVDIPKTYKKNIISLTSPLIKYIDRILFIIFIFLGLGIFYKYFINCRMYEQHIKIIKIISNHYDLTGSDSFFIIHPFVKLNEEILKFNRNLYTIKNAEELEIIYSKEDNSLTDEIRKYISKNKDLIQSSENILIYEDEFK